MTEPNNDSPLNVEAAELWDNQQSGSLLPLSTSDLSDTSLQCSRPDSCSFTGQFNEGLPTRSFTGNTRPQGTQHKKMLVSWLYTILFTDLNQYAVMRRISNVLNISNDPLSSAPDEMARGSHFRLLPLGFFAWSSRSPAASIAFRAAALICLNLSGPRCIPPKYRVTTTSTLFNP